MLAGPGRGWVTIAWRFVPVLMAIQRFLAVLFTPLFTLASSLRLSSSASRHSIYCRRASGGSSREVGHFGASWRNGRPALSYISTAAPLFSTAPVVDRTIPYLPSLSSRDTGDGPSSLRHTTIGDVRIEPSCNRCAETKKRYFSFAPATLDIAVKRGVDSEVSQQPRINRTRVQEKRLVTWPFGRSLLIQCPVRSWAGRRFRVSVMLRPPNRRAPFGGYYSSSIIPCPSASDDTDPG